MNWSADEVRSNPFTPREHDSLGKKSNSRNAIICVAFSQYNKSSQVEKDNIVEFVTGERQYTTHVVLTNIVKKFSMMLAA